MREFDLICLDRIAPCSIEALLDIFSLVQLIPSMKHHFVAGTVFESLCGIVLSCAEHAVFVICVLVDFSREGVLGDPHEPEELARVVRDPKSASEHDEDVVSIETLGYLVALLLVRCQSESHRGDVRVVPSIVVDEHSSIGHSSDLVAVVPPTEYFGLGVSVLLEPVVSFSVVVVNISVISRNTSRGQNNRWM